MTERPLPFFGAGYEAAAIAMGIVFLPVNFIGMISWSTLGSLFIAAGTTYLIKKFRSYDSFGPESFMTGIATPNRFQKGYDLFREAPRPYKSNTSK